MAEKNFSEMTADEKRKHIQDYKKGILTKKTAENKKQRKEKNGKNDKK